MSMIKMRWEGFGRQEVEVKGRLLCSHHEGLERECRAILFLASALD
jgi:hypothetical protein